jgi:hypothetical protein
MSEIPSVVVVMRIVIAIVCLASGLACDTNVGEWRNDMVGDGKREADCKRVEVQICSIRCLPLKNDLSLIIADNNAELYPGVGSSIPVADSTLATIFSSLSPEKNTLIVHLRLRSAESSEDLSIGAVDRCLQRIEQVFVKNSTSENRLIIRVFTKTRDASIETPSERT